MEEEKKIENNGSAPSIKEEVLDAIGNSEDVNWDESPVAEESQENEILSAVNLEPLKEEEMGMETPSNEASSAPAGIENSQDAPVLESPSSLVRGDIPLANSETKKTLARAERGYFGRIRGLLDNNSSFRALYEALRHTGKTFMSQKLREEEKAYDDLFIEKLEEGFEAIDSIILNPRTFIKENPELVDAGRAKKINAQSIVHLSSHTQYVYEVNQKNDVTPMKILTINSDVDYQIYENRFVWSLINKAALFIEKRYHYILDHGETRDSELLLLHNVTEIGGTRYELDSRIAVSRPSSDGGKAEHNANLLLRLARLRERAAYYRKSGFAESMKGAKMVANPIHRTNMIVKEPHYHACYELWTWLDSYAQLGVHFDIKETEHPFSEGDYEDLMCLVAASFLNVRSSLSEPLIPEKTKTKSLDPKVVFSLEDETYNDGRFLYDQFKDGLAPRKDEEEKDYANPESYPDFETAKKERKELEERFSSYAVKKHLVDLSIEEDKARAVALEAEERRKEADEEAKRKEKEKLLAKEKEIAKQRALQRAYAVIDSNQRMLEEERLRQTRAELRREALRAKGYVFPDAEPTPSVFLSPVNENEDKKKRYKTIKIVRELHSGRLITPDEQRKGEESGLKFVRVSKEELLRRRKAAKEAKEAKEVETKQETGENR